MIKDCKENIKDYLKNYLKKDYLKKLNTWWKYPLFIDKISMICRSLIISPGMNKR